MIDRARVLEDLKSVIKDLVEDLRFRTEEVDEVSTLVHTQYETARSAGRTDRSFDEWREDLLAQVAVGWVLGTVFVRFCEDNRLWPNPLISGPGSRRDLARDHRTDWLSRHPASGDRDWLMEVFGRYRETLATSGVFGPHNPLWQFGPSDDGARSLLDLWWGVNPGTGVLYHDFTDPELDTRFLGDLYQDLSDHAKKTFALLQTPEFVEEFILGRTLDPAIETFGLGTVRMIDPACGSGHFLLGAFKRLFDQWRDREPATPVRELVQRALDAVHGVDLNPFAVAIARFRLLVAAMQTSAIHDLQSAPDFKLHVATGDSLLHGRRSGQLFAGTEGFGPLMRHRYPTEDEEEANLILEAGWYHAVVGNPPYITVKEPALRDAYRALYETAYRQYSLGVPFTERFFDLAQPGTNDRAAGYVGMITTNSFMKREFGKKLIEEFLARRDLTHVIDTSGAYIPGHGTPTVILVGRNQAPRLPEIRALLGIRGEPGKPEDAAMGKVWTSILDMVDTPEAENAYLSSEDAPRERFSNHPWSLQGGMAPQVKEVIDAAVFVRLTEAAHEIGFGVVTREDEAFRIGDGPARRMGVSSAFVRPLVAGEEVRDWGYAGLTGALWPYSVETLSAAADVPLERGLWPYRRQLSDRVAYGKTQLERGLAWWEYSMFFTDRFRTPLSITFAFVATHNHFVLDRGGKVFNRSAPIIKLPADATVDDHLRLLGLLNSSTACFWMKQVFYPKGGDPVGQDGARLSQAAWSDRYEHDGTKLQQFPVPAASPLHLARDLDTLAQELEAELPARVLAIEPPSRDGLATARTHVEALRARMVALQEELDWECYHLYGLTDRPLVVSTDDLPELQRGQRAFEIALGRSMAEGRASSTWFERHGTTPITDLPGHWSKGYREIVTQRLELIGTDRKIRLLERPEYKRRWNWESWEDMEQAALRDWLLHRLESLPVWKEPELQTVGRLADRLARDAEVLEAARLLLGRVDVDLSELIGVLLEDEGVPYLAPLRFKPAGLRKRRAWEKIWELQRTEDEIDRRAAATGDDPTQLPEDKVADTKEAAGVNRIPVPPKYTGADFARTSWYRLRGKLDVPKERFISYPDTRIGADDSAVLGWAGWDHLQRAKALAGHFQRRKDEGAAAEELAPLLAGLEELVPWLLQWHNDADPEFGQRMGDFFRTYVDGEARALGFTRSDLRDWPLTFNESSP